jgi:hypothetical protein
VLTLLLAGCAVGSNGAAAGPASRSTRPSGHDGSSATDAPSPDAAILRTDGFVMPSGTKYCELDQRVLSCVITSGLPPPAPEEPCDLDLVGLAIEQSGGVTPMCSGDPGIIFDPLWPTLEYGQTWIRAHITCRSSSSSLSCSNRLGHGFTLSTAGWTSE